MRRYYAKRGKPSRGFLRSLAFSFLDRYESARPNWLRHAVDREIRRLSKYFLPLMHNNPSEAPVVSHRLMLRAGMIHNPAPASIPVCRSACAC